MTLSALTAISPIDGRYRNKVEALAAYFSEFALIRYRVRVEIEYLCLLAEVLPPVQTLNKDHVKTALRRIYLDFSYDDARRVKEIEQTTNHDVKAVEYFIKEQFDTLSLQAYKEFIHF